MFRANIYPSSGETIVFLRQLVVVILYGWLSGIHTRESSIQNKKYQLSQKHNCFSWWWVNIRPKHVEIDKYTKNKLCTNLALFKRICRDAQSTKHKMFAKISFGKFNECIAFRVPGFNRQFMPLLRLWHL